MYPYTPPIRDMQFLLHEVLNISASGLPGHAEMTAETTAQILEEAGRLSREVLAPLNPVGDRQGCRLENGTVITPDGFQDAYRQICAGGWTALDCDPAYGGQGMPYLLHTATGEMFVAANMAFNMYQGLTHGAISALQAHGTAAQKATYLPRLISGEWTGTMNLTEAQAGSDLGLIRTRAEPQTDGSFRITGEKIFISSGDHDLSRNVIHLVLARAPGGDEGTKGLSLFLVPKYLVSAEGTLGARNGVHVDHLERKMGIHGNATCAMRYAGATGWLVGDLHKGLRPMFTMMNEARAGVALQGYACAAAALGQAAAYARDRRQGQALGGPPGPTPILSHPDIRRSLMDQKSFVEGARALTFWAAHLIDRAKAGDAAAEALASLLIPVLKGFQTDKGFEMTVAAQQIFGGHGYVEDNGLSQFVRDARIAMIYEGANGIQALDLVGRKLPQNGGRAFLAFLAEVQGVTGDPGADPAVRAEVLDPLTAAARDLQAAATFFLQASAAAPRDVLAGASDFLHLFGHVAMGLMWARMARAAAGDDPFHSAKRATARYYMARHLPATALHLARIRSGAGPVMALPEASF